MWATIQNTHRECRVLQVQINRIHDYKHLVVLVNQSSGLAKGSLAEVLDPPETAEECRWQAEGESQFEGEGVDARREQSHLPIAPVVAQQTHLKVNVFLAIVRRVPYILDTNYALAHYMEL